MGDGILSAIAEAYIHFNFRDLNDNEFNAYSEQVSHLVSDIARKYYGKGSELELEIDDQSFLTKAVLIGKIFGWTVGGAMGIGGGIYGGMAIYPDVRQGIIQACEDAESFGIDVCDAVMKKLNVGPEDKIYKRIKPRELNSLVRIVDNIDKAIGTSGISSDKEKYLLSEIGKDISRLQKYGVPQIELEQFVSIIPKEAFPRTEVNTEALISSVLDVGGRAQSQVLHLVSEAMAPSKRARKRGHRYHKTIVL